MKFGQQLLSEFNLEWGPGSYVAYSQLKDLLKNVRDGKNEVDVFFHHLEIDLGKIDLFTRQQETTCYDHQQSLLHTVRNGLKKSDIFDVYTETRALSSYQELNKTCFEKIIKKFHKRMGLRLGTKKVEEESATEELSPKEKSDLRHRCDAFMESVEDAYFLNLEKLDIATALQSLHLLYAEGFSEGDEMLAQSVLEKVWSLDARSQPRIVDYVDAHYYKQNRIRKREMTYACKIVCGSTNRNLARNVSRCLGHKSLCAATVEVRDNGECDLQVLDNIRGDDVFVFQTVSYTDDVSLGRAQMELLLLVHTCRLASAARITAVIPYTAYQSRKQPMSAYAQMVNQMGADRILTVDLLQAQIQGFFGNAPLDNVHVLMEFVKYFKEKLDPEVDDYEKQVCIVAPRSTSVERAREFADELGCGLASVIRRRKEEIEEAKEEDGTPLRWSFHETSEIVGDVEGKICIVVSCILDEGENMVSVVEQLKAAGSTRCFAAAVHGVLAGEAVRRLSHSALEEIVVTDTICQDALLSRCSKLRVIPVAPLLAECIDRIHSEASIGTMVKSSKKAYQTRRVGNDDDVMQQLEGVDLAAIRRASFEPDFNPPAEQPTCRGCAKPAVHRCLKCPSDHEHGSLYLCSETKCFNDTHEDFRYQNHSGHLVPWATTPTIPAPAPKSSSASKHLHPRSPL